RNARGRVIARTLTFCERSHPRKRLHKCKRARKCISRINKPSKHLRLWVFTAVYLLYTLVYSLA
ncbi:MAG: hypothetical protein AAFY76_07050, partial [Cyanobacteria bacterium J06649_11]